MRKKSRLFFFPRFSFIANSFFSPLFLCEAFAEAAAHLMMRMCNEQSRDSELYTEAARATVRERGGKKEKKSCHSQRFMQPTHFSMFLRILTGCSGSWRYSFFKHAALARWGTPLGLRLVFGRNEAWCNNEHGEYNTYERMKQKSLITIQRRFVNNATTCLISLSPINL